MTKSVITRWKGKLHRAGNAILFIFFALCYRYLMYLMNCCRKMTREMMCMRCLEIQPVGPACSTPSCDGFLMAKYYCSICKFFDDERYAVHSIDWLFLSNKFTVSTLMNHLLVSIGVKFNWRYVMIHDLLPFTEIYFVRTASGMSIIAHFATYVVLGRGLGLTISTAWHATAVLGWSWWATSAWRKASKQTAQSVVISYSLLVQLSELYRVAITCIQLVFRFLSLTLNKNTPSS